MSWHDEKRALSKARRAVRDNEIVDEVQMETMGRPGAQYDHPQLRVTLNQGGTKSLTDQVPDDVYVAFAHILGSATDDPKIELLLKHQDAKGDA